MAEPIDLDVKEIPPSPWRYANAATYVMPVTVVGPTGADSWMIRLLSARSMDLVNKTKEMFAGAEVTDVRKPKKDIPEEIPF